MLPPPGIRPTPFRNSASKVARLQVHAPTHGFEQVFIFAGLLVDDKNKSEIFNFHWFLLLFLSVV